MTIRQLPNESSTSILSSSSIFSPISAIKELIDNSIDAGATSITIEVDLETIGLNYFSVKDNGSGIDKSDRPAVCLKSTTSKVTTIDEINMGMGSLGFRGEALFFLANLACKNKAGFGSLSISTKTNDDVTGEKWSVNSLGQIVLNSVKKIPLSTGTCVTVSGLFNSLPVRKKFLIKKRTASMGKLKDLVINYSFIYCNKIKFSLKYVKINSKNEVSNSTTGPNTANLVLNSNISHYKLLRDLISIKNLQHQFFNGDLEVFLNEDQTSIDTDDDNLTTHLEETPGSWKISYLLPIMKGEHQITSYSRPIKTLAINDRPLNVSIGFGKKINRLLASWYSEHKILPPNIWYINLKSPALSESTIAGDINIEPEKSDILLNREEAILKMLARHLVPRIIQAHDTEVVDLVKNVETSIESVKETEKGTEMPQVMDVIQVDEDSGNRTKAGKNVDECTQPSDSQEGSNEAITNEKMSNEKLTGDGNSQTVITNSHNSNANTSIITATDDDWCFTTNQTVPSDQDSFTDDEADFALQKNVILPQHSQEPEPHILQPAISILSKGNYVSQSGHYEQISDSDSTRSAGYEPENTNKNGRPKSANDNRIETNHADRADRIETVLQKSQNEFLDTSTQSKPSTFTKLGILSRDSTSRVARGKRPGSRSGSYPLAGQRGSRFIDQSRRLGQLFENTHCFTYDYTQKLDVVDGLEKGFQHAYEYYEVDMVDHEFNMKEFLLNAQKLENPESISGCKVKTTQKKQGWTLWTFE